MFHFFNFKITNAYILKRRRKFVTYKEKISKYCTSKKMTKFNLTSRATLTEKWATVVTYSVLSLG